jgi:hypothetical protein
VRCDRAAGEARLTSDDLPSSPEEELAQREALRELVLVDPAPALDQLVPETADVRDRAAERRQSELETGREDLCGRALGLTARPRSRATPPLG